MSVFDVAKYILEKHGEMSTWKLQKLCYYAQAWTLAWEERALFPEDFEAWANGPVCPALFREHQGAYIVNEKMIHGDSSALSEDDKENIDIVLRDYGSKDAYWLREQTHSEKPWQIARGNIPDGERCSNIISKEEMGRYYASL